MNDKQRKRERKNSDKKSAAAEVWLKMRENVTDAELDALGINHEASYCDPRGQRGVLISEEEDDEVVVEFSTVAEGLTNDYRMKMKIPRGWTEASSAPEKPREYVAL